MTKLDIRAARATKLNSSALTDGSGSTPAKYTHCSYCKQKLGMYGHTECAELARRAAVLRRKAAGQKYVEGVHESGLAPEVAELALALQNGGMDGKSPWTHDEHVIRSNEYANPNGEVQSGRVIRTAYRHRGVKIYA